MDRTLKFLLFVIASSLVMLNLQLAGVSLVRVAHAEFVSVDLRKLLKAQSSIYRSMVTIYCSR